MKRNGWTVLAALAAGLSAATLARAGAHAAGDARRGEYLVKAVGCNDCHTPLTMGPQGPEPDVSRMLSGHPEALAMPPAPAPQGPWLVAASATNTAWSGPWGVSFTANLTPDPETGLGRWTEQDFVDAIRTGRHMGRGRPILPPMPAQALANLTDEDLKAVYAYLRTLAPIRNRVPEPVAPAQPAPARP